MRIAKKSVRREVRGGVHMNTTRIPHTYLADLGNSHREAPTVKVEEAFEVGENPLRIVVCTAALGDLYYSRQIRMIGMIGEVYTASRHVHAADSQ